MIVGSSSLDSNQLDLLQTTTTLRSNITSDQVIASVQRLKLKVSLERTELCCVQLVAFFRYISSLQKKIFTPSKPIDHRDIQAKKVLATFHLPSYTPTDETVFQGLSRSPYRSDIKQFDNMR